MNLDEKTRAYVYRIATAVMGLLLVVGLVTEEIATEVLFVMAAILGIGEGALAIKNTSTKDAS